MVGCSICTAEVEWILHHPSGLWTAKCHTCGCQASCEDGLITLDKSACKAPTSARPSATTTEGQKIPWCVACKSSTGVATVEKDALLWVLLAWGKAYHGPHQPPSRCFCAGLSGPMPRWHQRKLSTERWPWRQFPYPHLLQRGRLRGQARTPDRDGVLPRVP